MFGKSTIDDEKKSEDRVVVLKKYSYRKWHSHNNWAISFHVLSCRSYTVRRGCKFITVWPKLWFFLEQIFKGSFSSVLLTLLAAALYSSGGAVWVCASRHVILLQYLQQGLKSTLFTMLRGIVPFTINSAVAQVMSQWCLDLCADEGWRPFICLCPRVHCLTVCPWWGQVFMLLMV